MAVKKLRLPFHPALGIIICQRYAEFNDRYNQRDVSARNNMRELVDSDANKVTKVFSTLFER